MRIGIVGDVMVDRYWVGKASGLSAEALIPVVKIESKFDLPGGAGNVRANLRALGEDAVVLLRTDQHFPVKNRLLVEGQQVARWDEGDYANPLTKADLLPLLDCEAVVVSDYGKGTVSPEVVEVLRETTMPLFVDTKADPSVWIGSTATLFPNLKEYKQYQEKYNWIGRVVLKQGAEGASLLEFGNPIMSRPAKVRNIVNVCGAGDTVMAAFISSYLAGCNLDYCLEYAMAAAAVVCQKPFTSVASVDEIQAVLSGYVDSSL